MATYVNGSSSSQSEGSSTVLNGPSTSLEPKPNVIYGPNGSKMIPNRIFVGGMSRETTESDLHHFFLAYGNVKNVKIITDANGQSKGYGFVTFGSEEEALRIQSLANNAVLHNRKLNIGPAIKRNLPINSGGQEKPNNNGTTAEQLNGYSSLLPGFDPVLYPPMMPYYGLSMNFPYMYSSQNHQYPF